MSDDARKMLSIVMGVEKLLNAPTADAARIIIADNPELLSNTAMSLLGGIITNTRRKGGTNAALRLAQIQRELQAQQDLVDKPSQPAKLDKDLFGRLLSQARQMEEDFLRSGDKNILAKALKTCRKILEDPDFLNTPKSFRGSALQSIGIIFIRNFEFLGDEGDLNLALTCWEDAVELVPPGTIEAASCYNNLANGFKNRYWITGNAKDLDLAIKLLRQALDSTPQEAPLKAGLHQNLGVALLDRYGRTTDLSDLQDATDNLETSVKITPSNAPHLADRMNSLGNCLIARYQHSEDIADIRRGSKYFERAVKLAPQGSPSYLINLSSLGNGYRSIYKATQDLEALHMAIAAYEHVVGLAPRGAALAAAALTNLGNSLGHLYNKTSSDKVIERSIEVLRESVRISPADSPYTPSRLLNIAEALRIRHRISGQDCDMKEAISYFHQASREGIERDLSIALSSSSTWLTWAFDRQSWQEVDLAHEYANSSIEKLLRIHCLRVDREKWLKKMQGIATKAAYAKAKLGKLKESVVTLEGGLARLLTQSLKLDILALDNLKSFGRQDIYLEYMDVVERIHALESKTSARTTRSSLSELYDELGRITRIIKNIPGYGNIFDEISFQDIQGATDNRTIVYLLSTTSGGLALLVDDDVGAVWLPSFSRSKLKKVLATNAEDIKKGGYLAAFLRWQEKKTAVTYEDIQTEVDKVSGWLWESVISRLLDNLNSRTNLTLVPVGSRVQMLPLHAAWRKDLNVRIYALDELSICYAPNALSLSVPHAVDREASLDEMVIVGQTQAKDLGELPNSRHEIQIVSSFFENVRLILDQEATRAAIRRALERCAAVHFCCHGNANLMEPLSSGLSVFGEQVLTIRDILEIRSLDLRLAVLSACETNIPGFSLPDEAVSLPSALMRAGVSGVVASLWAVPDISTTILMSFFYHCLRTKDMAPDEALRRAQQAVRDFPVVQYLNEAQGQSQNMDSNPHAICPIFTSELFATIDKQQLNGIDLSHPFHWAGFVYCGS